MRLRPELQGSLLPPGPVIRNFGQQSPRIHSQAWIAPGAVVVGDVEIGADSSLWYGTVVRGDVAPIRIGARSNIQDGSIVHVTRDRFPTTVGNEVTVGHRSVIHGCVIEDGALIGIGAVVLDGAHIGSGALVAAGALVPPGAKVEAGTLVMGTPARFVRELDQEERQAQLERTLSYVETARAHAHSGAGDGTS